MSNSMERAFSVSDLVGGLWRLGQAGMGRTDSEAAFEEFLKRIPSATNLAAVAQGSDNTTSVQQQLSHLQQHQASSAAPALTTTPLSELNTGAGLGGIPRVPSLDFLRQLVVNQQYTQTAVPPPLKVETPAPTATASLPNFGLGGPFHGLGAAELAHLQTATGLAAALQGMPGLPPAANPLGSSGAMNPLAAAAALQLARANQLGALAPPITHETLEKSEQRRARRMLSNRESARRSRRRKQEHLSKLEQEINAVAEERKSLSDKTSVLERRCASIEDENKRLREENERLRDELRFLRTELTERKERNGYHRRDDNDEGHVAKKQKAGKGETDDNR